MACKDIPYNPPEDPSERRKYNAWYNEQICPKKVVEHTKVDEEKGTNPKVKSFIESFKKGG